MTLYAVAKRSPTHMYSGGGEGLRGLSYSVPLESETVCRGDWVLDVCDGAHSCV